MSLIVARKENEKIVVVSDTKLTPPDGQDLKKGRWVDGEDNVIKATIISPVCCVCFAGNVRFAEEVIHQLDPQQSTKGTCEKLLNKHLESSQTTEFICCIIAESRSSIFEIKSGVMTETEASWIGSQTAFHRFQEYILGHSPSSRKNVISIRNENSGRLLHQMTDAIDEVIQDEAIPEVAGFKICVKQNNNRFEYEGYLESYFAPEQLIISGSQFLTHGSPGQGAYTVNFFNSHQTFKHIGLHIRQGNFGLIYSRHNNGLFRPQLFKDTDELDFLDITESKYQLSTYGITQDAFNKFGTAAKTLFEQKDYLGAIRTFDSGLKHLKDHQKAQFLYNKAICLIHLEQINEAISLFSEAIEINPSHKSDATRIIQEVLMNGVRK